MGYNPGEAAGLLAGSQTISAVIGVAEDTMANMGLDEAQRQSYINIIPVSYAVTYVFGTAGSAWVLSSLGPKLLGGLEKVKAACKELEAKMGSSEADEPGFMHAARPVTFRAYKIENEWFKQGRRVIDLEMYFQKDGKRLFVERLRKQGVVRDVSPNTVLNIGDEVVLSGRREFVIGDTERLRLLYSIRYSGDTSRTTPCLRRRSTNRRLPSFWKYISKSITRRPCLNHSFSIL